MSVTNTVANDGNNVTHITCPILNIGNYRSDKANVHRKYANTSKTRADKIRWKAEVARRGPNFDWEAHNQKLLQELDEASTQSRFPATWSKPPPKPHALPTSSTPTTTATASSSTSSTTIPTILPPPPPESATDPMELAEQHPDVTPEQKAKACSALPVCRKPTTLSPKPSPKTKSLMHCLSAAKGPPTKRRAVFSSKGTGISAVPNSIDPFALGPPLPVAQSSSTPTTPTQQTQAQSSQGDTAAVPIDVDEPRRSDFDPTDKSLGLELYTEENPDEISTVPDFYPDGKTPLPALPAAYAAGTTSRILHLDVERQSISTSAQDGWRYPGNSIEQLEKLWNPEVEGMTFEQFKATLEIKGKGGKRRGMTFPHHGDSMGPSAGRWHHRLGQLPSFPSSETL